jgi:DNA replication protein DnaC
MGAVNMDTPQVLLEHHLKALRLPTFLREYDKVAQQCAAEGVDFPRYLLRLSELELLDRERRATERRIRQAKFEVIKSLDSFEFASIPSLNKALVLELARCEFIERKENVLALGNSGTGKTHLALALGLAACQKGFRVRFTTAASLAHELIEAKDERRLMRFQKMLSSFELLIIDELGFVPLSKTGAELLRSVQPPLRTQRDAGHQQLAVQRMDRGVRIGAVDRSIAGSADASRSHFGNEWRELPVER